MKSPVASKKMATVFEQLKPPWASCQSEPPPKELYGWLILDSLVASVLCEPYVFILQYQASRGLFVGQSIGYLKVDDQGAGVQVEKRHVAIFQSFLKWNSGLQLVFMSKNKLHT